MKEEEEAAACRCTEQSFIRTTSIKRFIFSPRETSLQLQGLLHISKQISVSYRIEGGLPPGVADPSTLGRSGTLRRARIEGSWTFVPLNFTLESYKEEEEGINGLMSLVRV